MHALDVLGSIRGDKVVYNLMPVLDKAEIR